MGFPVGRLPDSVASGPLPLGGAAILGNVGLVRAEERGEAFGVTIPQEPLMRAGAKPENKRWRSKTKAAAKSKFPC